MNGTTSALQVLLVEDDPEDLAQFTRDFPDIFAEHGVSVRLHTCDNFEDAIAQATDPLFRYDLIVSDTYKGAATSRDAQALELIKQYRGHRFCPLVIYSSGVKPEGVPPSAFVLWADKATPGDIGRVLAEMLKTSIPQLARKLHDELDAAGSFFLWEFLENAWQKLNTPVPMERVVLERLLRKRAAIQVGDLDPETEGAQVSERDPAEYYVYPALGTAFRLGDVVQSKANGTDIRVILTPHCHLRVQQGKDSPRAEFVLTVKTITAKEVLGSKLEGFKEDRPKREKRIGQWCRSPAQTDRQPEGRHWFLPAFLDIPYSFCDFLQVESIPFATLSSDFRRMATLVPPYAEALQSCFGSYYSSVGIPTTRAESLVAMLG